jgi:drug/metabolite transporter (DMT)-like permease
MVPLSARLRGVAPARRLLLRRGARVPVTRADGAMLGTMLLWGVNISAAKVVVSAVSPAAFGVLRYSIATLVLGVLLWRYEGSLRVRLRDLPRLGLVGGVGLGVYQLCFLAGISRISASLAALLLAVSPLLTAAVAALWYHEPLGRRSVAVLAFSFGGVALVVLGAGPAGRASWLGALLILGAALCVALSAVWSTGVLRAYSSLRVTAWMCVAGTAIFLPQGVPALLHTPAAAWSPQVVAAALSVVIGGTILGNLAWNYAVQQIGATRTAVYTYMQPVVGVLIAVVALGERPGAAQALGGAIILLGLLAYPRPRTNAGDPGLSVETGSPAPKDAL